MRKNVGGSERSLRLLVGALFVVVGIAGYVGMLSLAWIGLGQALASVIVVLLGAILLLTGAIQWCPISRVLGISTYRGDSGRDEEAAGSSIERTT